MTEPWAGAETRISLGGSVLGAIDPAERALVDAHLATCRDCRDELAGLAGLPALLARVNPEEIGRIDGEGAIAAGTQAPPELISTVLDLAAARRRRTWWRYAGAAAAVVALAGGVFGGVAATRPTPAPASVAIPFNPGNTSWDWATGKSGTSDITATVDYGSERWGTVLAAKTSGIPVGTTCQLWVVHKDGSRTKVTEWTTAPDEGKVWYWGAMSMPSTDKGIKSFQVTEGTKLLVTIRPI
jgi:anti-sigma-K factor RskA